MLTIRKEQIEVMAEATRRDFEVRLTTHLESSVGKPFSELEVRQGIEAARECGMKRERDLGRFCELLYQLSGGFRLDALGKNQQNVFLAYGAPVAGKLKHLESLAAEVRRD
jgi:hypothetical protein